MEITGRTCNVNKPLMWKCLAEAIIDAEISNNLINAFFVKDQELIKTPLCLWSLRIY
jgi:hypothetical protein